MENKEELEIDIDDIGAILKSSRLKQKKSLEDVSGELCIRKIYLTALEEGDYETLPPVPYGVGYVRTYANYLGLSAERAVKLYKNASLIEEQAKQEDLSFEPEVNKSSNKHIIVGIVVLLSIYILFSVFHKSSSDKVIKEEQAPIEQVEQIEEVVETIIDDNIVSEKEETNEDINNNAKEEIIEESQNQIDETKVIVEFTGETWFELKDKNKVYFQGIYHNGDKKEIDYVGNLFLSAGRPKNVKIYVKGQEKNILTKRRKTNIAIDSL